MRKIEITLERIIFVIAIASLPIGIFANWGYLLISIAMWVLWFAMRIARIEDIRKKQIHKLWRDSINKKN